MRRTLLSLAVVLAAVLAPTTAAVAEDDTKAWSVRPATAEGKTDARTHITLQGNPGATAADQVLVTNQSKSAVTLNVYGTDAFNTSEGGFDLLSRDRKPTDLGSWMVFTSGTVSLEAGQSVAVPFKVVVPPSATPGDHAAGVVVSLLTTSNDPSKKVNLDTRVAVRVYMRVPGNLQPRLSVESPSLKYGGVLNPLGKGEVTLNYTVTNPGNIRLRASQKLKLTSVFGTVTERSLPDLPELLPESSTPQSVTVDGVFPAGPMTAVVELQPVVDPQQPVGQIIGAVSGTASTWAVPWTLLAAVVVLLVLLVILFWLLRRRSARRLDRAMREARETVVTVP